VDATVGAGGAAGGLVSLLRDAWRSWRYGARASVSLIWHRYEGWIIGEPLIVWRMVELTLTAPKHNELVVASGLVQARKSPQRWRALNWRWTAIGSLNSVMLLPVTVPANRQHSVEISGSLLAAALKPHFEAGVLLELRITMADFHKTKVVTATGTVTRRELARNETRIIPPRP